MKKFIVTYHAPAESMKVNTNASKEDMQKGMEQWMTWAQKCGEKLVDMGSPLAGGRKVETNGQTSDSQKQVCGYSVLQADSMEDAVTLMDGHPHLGWAEGCEIEVHECMPLPGSGS